MSTSQRSTSGFGEAIWFPRALDPDGTLWRSHQGKGRGRRQGQGRPGDEAVPLAILEVGGVSLLWRDPAFQLQWIERFRRLLLSVSFPFQLLVRNGAARESGLPVLFEESASTPAQLIPRSTEDSATGPGPGPGPGPGLDLGNGRAGKPIGTEADLSEDHPLKQEQRFLQELLRRSEVRWQRVFLVVTGERLTPWGPFHGVEQRAHAHAHAQHLLEERVALLESLLASLGLPVRRLSAEAVLEVLYQCYQPEQARRLPLGDPERLTSWPGLLRLEPALQQEPSSSWLDWVAPSAVERGSHVLLVSGQPSRGWLVRAWPRWVRGLWLWPLITSGIADSLVLSWHLVPVSPSTVQRLLRRKLLEYQSLATYLEEHRRLLDPQLRLAQSDASRLLEQLTTGEERLWLVSWYLLLQAPSGDELDRAAAQLELLLRQSNVWAVPALYEQDRVWTSCLPLGLDEARVRLLLDTRTLASCFPFLHSTVLQPAGILEGCSLGTPVFLDRWDSSWRNANRLIVGASGTGKSFKVKLDLLRWLARQPGPAAGTEPGPHGWTRPLPFVRSTSSPSALVDVSARATADRSPSVLSPPSPDRYQAIVVDPEGEYVPLSHLLEDLGGHLLHLRAGGPGTATGFGFNPFALPLPPRPGGAEAGHSSSLVSEAAEDDEEEQRQTLLAEQIQWICSLVELLLTRGQEPLSAAEWALLERAVRETYRERGITADPRTHTQDPPLLRDLSRILQSGVCGPDGGLAERLQPFVSGSAASLFEPTPQEEQLLREASCVVVDVSRLPQALRPVAQFLIVHWVWRLAREAPCRRHLILDEFWGLFSEVGPAGRLLLERLFQRARKYGLAIDGITQHLRMLEHSSILANCASVLLLGQEPAALDFLQERFHLSQAEVRLLQGLRKGEGLLLLGEWQHLVLSFPVSQALYPFLTTDPREQALRDQALKARKDSQTHSGSRGELLPFTLPSSVPELRPARASDSSPSSPPPPGLELDGKQGDEDIEPGA